MFGLKRYNYASFTKDQLMKDAAVDKFSGPAPGDRAPDFQGRTLDGDSVRLSDFQGEKNVVLTFGSATCPFTAASIRGLNDAFEEFSGEDVQFLFVYVREAHPGERMPAHGSMQDKIRAAELFRENEEISMPIIVDELNGTIHRKYGKLPNSTFIIDKSGRIAFRSLWTRPAVVEEALDELLELQKERGADHAIVHNGEDSRMPSMYSIMHAHRALERGGTRAVQEFQSELGVSGRLAVAGSRIARPIAEHPGRVIASAAIVAGVLTGAIMLGRMLRERRFRSPYDIHRYDTRRRSGESGDYEAVGI